MISNKVAVSVIIPVYNVELYLEKCLDSLINQTLKNIEIILINDCSTDNSEVIIQDYLKLDSRIVYLQQSTNQGQGFARNYGIKKAKGEYILFVDSDDYIKPDAAELLYNKAKSLDLDVLEADYFKVGNNVVEQRNRQFDSVLSGEEYFETIPYTVGVIWNKLWKTSFIKKHKLYFVKEIFEDVIYLSRAMMYAKRVYRFNYTFYYYIIRDGSTMTSKVTSKHINSQIKLIQQLDLMHKENKGKLGNGQRLKVLLYALSGFATFISNYTPMEDEKGLKLKAKAYLKKINKAYRNEIFSCNKLGRLQKLLFYISPYLVSFVLSNVKKA